MRTSGATLVRVCTAGLALIGAATFQQTLGAGSGERPRPTYSNVTYGAHPHQILDVWKCGKAGRRPVVVHFHGGAWVRGDKADFQDAALYLAAGFSVVSVNYRFVWQARDAGVRPPVAWPMEDACRALQLVRYRADEWGFDPARIGAIGDSAGACLALWLALHADMAEPSSTDPVRRQSTRLSGAALTGAQTTLDPKEMREWTPNSFYGGHAFGFVQTSNILDMGDFAAFLSARNQILDQIQRYSPYALAGPAAPPLWLSYRAPPALGQKVEDPTHTANFGVRLQEKLRAAGVNCEVVYPGAEGPHAGSALEFLAGILLPGTPP